MSHSTRQVVYLVHALMYVLGDADCHCVMQTICGHDQFIELDARTSDALFKMYMETDPSDPHFKTTMDSVREHSTSMDLQTLGAKLKGYLERKLAGDGLAQCKKRVWMYYGFVKGIHDALDGVADMTFD